MQVLAFFLALVAAVAATPLIWDGRAPFNLTEADLDSSTGPYLTGVKGSGAASHYSTLLELTTAPTPLWYKSLLPPLPLYVLPSEQAIRVTIDNTSVFVPGPGPPQYGFRRTELLAQANGDHLALQKEMEVHQNVYHFSIKIDDQLPLNYKHEYQIVWIEPSDGSHVFGIQLGSPFTNPAGPLPVSNAHSFKVLDHALNVLFSTPAVSGSWHNFGVLVDWDRNTLGVLYSRDVAQLQAVTHVVSNPTVPANAAGNGEFHFGVLKLPLGNTSDVVHSGYQEGTKEGLLYSGVFVENTTYGISSGYSSTFHPF